MNQTYKGAFIVAEYNNGQIILKAYAGKELIDKQRYIGYSNSLSPKDFKHNLDIALKAFKHNLDLNYFQFNTITL